MAQENLEVQNITVNGIGPEIVVMIHAQDGAIYKVGDWFKYGSDRLGFSYSQLFNPNISGHFRLTGQRFFDFETHSVREDPASNHMLAFDGDPTNPHIEIVETFPPRDGRRIKRISDTHFELVSLLSLRGVQFTDVQGRMPITANLAEELDPIVLAYRTQDAVIYKIGDFVTFGRALWCRIQVLYDPATAGGTFHLEERDNIDLDQGVTNPDSATADFALTGLQDNVSIELQGPSQLAELPNVAYGQVVADHFRTAIFDQGARFNVFQPQTGVSNTSFCSALMDNSSSRSVGLNGSQT